MTIRTNDIYTTQASLLENDTHKFLWDFDIQTDHQISARRPNKVIINKKKKKKKKKRERERERERTYKIVDFAVPADHRIKLKESEKKNKYLDHTMELKTLRNMQVTIYTNRDWYFWYKSPKDY